MGLSLLLTACGGTAETTPQPASSSAAPATTTDAVSASPTTTASAPASAESANAPVASGSALPSPSTSGEPLADPGKLKLTGKVIQGAVLFAKVDGKVGRIDFPGHRAVVSDDGEFPIAFARNAPKTEKMVIHFKDGTKLEHSFEVEQRTYETDTISGLPEDEVRLDPKTKKAHAADEKKVAHVRMQYSKDNCYKDGFIWPVSGKVTSHYGVNRVLNGTDGGIHWGVDIAVKSGTPVKAPACGTVVFTDADIPLSGGTLILDHGQGLTSTFIHLSGFKKKVGDKVKQGDVLATSGSTGRTTGPHLDWRMNYFEVRVDPELLAPPMK
jgi:murein DD-endopeptidase MepM/ murein hydrolase activator NlpD